MHNLPDSRINEAVTYNKKQSWERSELPYPFDQSVWTDEQFAVLVSAFQQWRGGMDVDGKLGPQTLRRLMTEVESSKPPEPDPVVPEGISRLILNGRRIPIEWDRVVLYTDEGGLSCVDDSYTEVEGDDREITHFVCHWDAALSASSMARIIAKRKLSIHFAIDNDGTIFQLLDMQHRAWHSGHKHGNKYGLGVEISNAYYPKYQDWYVRHGFGERPILSGVEVHGRTLDPFTGFYPVQVQALKALIKALHQSVGIPLECPSDEEGVMLTGLSEEADKGDFRGFCHHFHLTTRKKDAAGLDLGVILDQILSEI